jgi:beta-ureidopropionase
LVKVGSIQNKIVLPTDAPVQKQKQAIFDRITQIIELAALEKTNVICLQEIWTAPFFMCTREKYPWVEFSEHYDGESTQLLRHLAKKYNMVIISSILEREKYKETLHNTAVVIDNFGDIMGKQVKGHIPRVGDFNESSYYMEGESGHPVFDTQFGKLAINICYGRHHPLHWMGFGLNGAEIVFNPSATINGLSEPLWGI